MSTRPHALTCRMGAAHSDKRMAAHSPCTCQATGARCPSQPPPLTEHTHCLETHTMPACSCPAHKPSLLERGMLPSKKGHASQFSRLTTEPWLRLHSAVRALAARCQTWSTRKQTCCTTHPDTRCRAGALRYQCTGAQQNTQGLHCSETQCAQRLRLHSLSGHVGPYQHAGRMQTSPLRQHSSRGHARIACTAFMRAFKTARACSRHMRPCIAILQANRCPLSESAQLSHVAGTPLP